MYFSVCCDTIYLHLSYIVMKTSVTLRIPTLLLQKVKKSFPAQSQTKSLLTALEQGVSADHILEQKMIADYSSITADEYEFVSDGQKIMHEIWQDEAMDAEYLALLS